MKKTVWLGILFFVVFVGLVVYSTMGTNRYRCEVCVVFAGRTACRTASARTQQEAMRTALVNACAQVASGVTDSNQCETAPPKSIRWLSR
jgi:hypothetical protein